MSDQTTPTPVPEQDPSTAATAPLPVSEPVPAAAATAESATIPAQPVAEAAPAQKHHRTGMWVAAMAGALVLAVALSAVSFGAGVFVGRMGDRAGGRGEAFMSAPNGQQGQSGQNGFGQGQPPMMGGQGQQGQGFGQGQMPQGQGLGDGDGMRGRGRHGWSDGQSQLPQGQQSMPQGTVPQQQ